MFDDWNRLAKENKAKYPPGTRIKLIHMNDPFAPVPEGTKGTVRHVDDAGQIHMSWDNGRSLALVSGEDSFRTLTAEELAIEQAEKKTVVQFGDECEISIPSTPIDCTKLGYFDELEYDCWDLVKKYCDKFGIEMKSGEISFDIAKGIQDHIIEQFQNAGVEFNFNNDITEGEAPVLGM